MSQLSLDFDFGIKQEQIALVQSILKNPKQKKILVDGNIGAGKTTLVKLLEAYYNEKGLKTKAILEPVDIWRESGALQYFYGDISGRSYEFQTFTFITRIKRVFEDILSCPNADIYIFERHIWSDRYIFGALLKEQFGEVRLKMYEMWWDMWAYIFPLEGRQWVLLATDVDTSYKRIAIRNRGEETSSVSREYLQQLHDKHKEFYDSLHTNNENTKIVSADIMETDFIRERVYLEYIGDFIIN